MRQEVDIERQTPDLVVPPPGFEPLGLLDRLPGMAYRCQWDGEWGVEFVSQGVIDLTGYDRTEISSQSIRWSQLIHDEDLIDVVKRYRQAAHDGRTFHIRYRIRTSDSRVRWVHETGKRVSPTTSFPACFEGYIVAEETTPALEATLESGADAAHTLDQALDIFVAVDEQGAVRAWNRHAERKSGWSRAEVLGRDLVDLVVEPEYRDRVRAHLAHLVENQVAEELSAKRDLRVVGRDGSTFPIELNVWASYEDDRLVLNAFVRDRTLVVNLQNQVAELEERLERLSSIDELTGLASRAVLDTELARSVAFARRWRQPLSVVVVSPQPLSSGGDDDSAVHEALVAVSDIVRSSCRTEDVAARFDDTAILLLRQTSELGAGVVADRLLRKLRMSEWAGRVHLQVGLASLERSDDAASLVERALQDLGPEKRTAHEGPGPRARQASDPPEPSAPDPSN